MITEEEMANAYPRLVEENKRLREALEVADTAIKDWLHIHEPDHCHEDRVAEARKRVFENGSLFYIATTLSTIAAALKEGQPNE